MNNSFPGIPRSAVEGAGRMTAMVRDGRIKQHLLGDTSQRRYGTIEDKALYITVAVRRSSNP